MTNQGYRIQKLTVANFRGITETRTIDVARRHLFLLGPNGFGKSTIVEAIRWCLFGSPPGQQEIEVRNTFCPSETSDAVLDLLAGERMLHVRRQLSPGASRSRQTIMDSQGNVVTVGQVFPQLTRLGHPTGTQVIFAAQHAAGGDRPRYPISAGFCTST
jgi:DNA repair exonuclease SbcCD ATPase subunit